MKYEQRMIEVERASFNPLNFANIAEAGPNVSLIEMRLARKISEQKDESYADAIAYIRTKGSLALLRSSILCVRGQRSSNTKNKHKNVILPS